MAANLLDLLNGLMSPEVVGGLAHAVGESQPAVRQGATALLPTLLAGLAQRATAAGGAGPVFAVITGPGTDAGLAGTMTSLLTSGKAGDLLQRGTGLLTGLFGGDRVSRLGQALAAVSGLKASSASSLASLVAPLALSALKGAFSSLKLDAAGAANLLSGQKDHLSGKLDPRLTAALGLGAPAALLAGLSSPGVASLATTAGAAAVAAGAAATVVAGSAATGAAVAEHGTSAVAAAAAATGAAAATHATVGSGSGAVLGEGAGIGRWLPWVIGAAIVGFLVLQLKGGDKPAPAPVVEAPAPPPPAAPVPVVAAPAPVEFAWPARVYFETGRATTDAAGQATLKSAAEALVADPAKKVSVTGYTDKTGNPDANAALAKDRAVGVRQALQAAGVAEDRITMKPPIFVEAGKDPKDPQARRVDVILE